MTDSSLKRGVTPDRVPTIVRMTVVGVFTAVDRLIMAGLAVRILLRRRSRPVALPPSPDGPGEHRVAPRDPAVHLEPQERDPVHHDEMWQDFVANVSHELKTPVGAVALLAEAMIDAADDPHQVHWFANKILREANRLGTLVTELIALSRLQGAERLPAPATVEVDDLVREAVARCSLAAESANIQIAVDSPSRLLLTGDATLLVTALSNLIGNAVSYSPPGSPVSVSTRLAHDFVEIAVTDQGRGIEPEYQPRVFERFFRVDQALSRSTGGTGLGLAIVKRVAINHGGDVQLRSKPGIGSTFTLRIPAPQHRAQRTKLSGGAAPPARPAAQPFLAPDRRIFAQSKPR